LIVAFKIHLGGKRRRQQHGAWLHPEVSLRGTIISQCGSAAGILKDPDHGETSVFIPDHAAA
jgi:hypothetical protein